MSELTLSPQLFHISPEVQEALNNNQPVVALESTIISHGMPFPQNAQTAIEVEETIRQHGAVPATIAIINGVMKVGLSKDEIELLSRPDAHHKKAAFHHARRETGCPARFAGCAHGQPDSCQPAPARQSLSVNVGVTVRSRRVDHRTA